MSAILRAALYARYSSENQRKESIEDQLATCRGEAVTRGFAVLEAHVYTDHARSGASQDRPGLLALLAAAKQRLFDVLLIDDLSRLARDNLYMLITLSELSFHDVRVISVADGLDSADPRSKLVTQFRGIINELALSDLSDRTRRGQHGQKERGYTVGERTYGYRSVEAGQVRIDKHGRSPARRLQAEGRSPAGGYRRPHLRGVRFRCFHRADRPKPQQGRCADRRAARPWLGSFHGFPHSPPREVHWPLDLESHRHAARSPYRPPSQVHQAGFGTSRRC